MTPRMVVQSSWVSLRALQSLTISSRLQDEARSLVENDGWLMPIFRDVHLPVEALFHHPPLNNPAGGLLALFGGVTPQVHAGHCGRLLFTFRFSEPDV